MTAIESTKQLELQVRQLAAEGNFETALNLIKSTAYAALLASRRHGMLCFGSAQIDALCVDLGRHICAKIVDTLSPLSSGEESRAPLDLYVASHLYDTGGHTPLIGDYIRGNPGRRSLLAITNVDNAMTGMTRNVLDHAGVPASQTLLCTEPASLEKFKWLADLILRLKPARVFLFNHFYDSVAISACAALVHSRLVFVHHADRNPCLGAFLKSALHVDVSPFCYVCCREKAGSTRNVFVPLVVEEEGYRAFGDGRSRAGPLTTASAGSELKFSLDYSPNYIDAVVELLRSGNGRHIHIGGLREDYLTYFRVALRDAGISDDRIRFVSGVPSVWEAMLEFGVDLFINSFPARGARTSIEVMGSGTPIVWHVGSAETRFHDTHMKYAEAETWQTLGELSGIVRRIDDGWLQFQSRSARRHYERYHAPGLIERYLSQDPILGCGMQLDPPIFDQPALRSLDEVISAAKIDQEKVDR